MHRVIFRLPSTKLSYPILGIVLNTIHEVLIKNLHEERLPNLIFEWHQDFEINDEKKPQRMNRTLIIH